MVKTVCVVACKGVIEGPPDRFSDILPKHTGMRQECQFGFSITYLSTGTAADERLQTSRVNLRMGRLSSSFRNRIKGTDSNS